MKDERMYLLFHTIINHQRHRTCRSVRIKAPKVSGIYGRVISYGIKAETPIPHARVERLEYRNDEWGAKAEVSTGDDGRFSFENIGRGTYHLRVSSFAFRSIETEIKLDNSSPAKKVAREIIIGLEPMGCGNVTVRKIQASK